MKYNHQEKINYRFLNLYLNFPKLYQEIAIKLNKFCKNLVNFKIFLKKKIDKFRKEQKICQLKNYKIWKKWILDKKENNYQI